MFFTAVTQEIKWSFDMDFLNTESEIQFLISSGTFSPSWSALYAMLFKLNFLVLEFWDANMDELSDC